MMNNWRAWVFKFIVLTTLLSCSSSSFKNDDYGLDLQTCSGATQNEFVHRAMQDRYYWYQEIPNIVDYSAFSSPNDVVDALKFKPNDRFSYVTTATAFDSFYSEGQYVGFGFGYDQETGYLRFVYDNSPFGKANLKRGDKIVSIDGVLTADIIAADNWGTVFGSAVVGVSRDFVIEHQDASQTSLNLTKAVVTINTVLASESFVFNEKQYAYLAFKNFITPSLAELETAFAQFKADGAEKLVLDLRYNGGGSINVAAILASYIYQADENREDVFTSLRYNNKYSDANYNFYFNNETNGLNLDEVIILTTEGSCSASEMVINALEPFIDVTVIGSTTCGKPIGMRSQNFCSNKLVAINFQGFNSDGFGDYFDGLKADCAAQDDVNFAFGDVNEPMLKAALDYDNNGMCVAAKVSQKSKSQRLSSYQGLKSEYASE